MTRKKGQGPRDNGALVFYISGHGFGHAIRQIEIIDAVSALMPSAPIVVRTSAPTWLFERTLRARYTMIHGEVDTGVVQHDSLRLDEAETIRRAAAFYDDLERRADDEAAILEHHHAALVISDAPPLACASAARARVPSVVCANFTWDWIYAAYAEHLTAAPKLLPAIREAYALAASGWRLPMHGGFDAIGSVVDVPFVARRSRPELRREDIRRLLGLPLQMPLALVSFGGYGVEGLPLDRVDCVPAWSLVTTGADRASERRGVFALQESAIYSSGLRYEHLVRAADVVISKPGYGIISDCIANEIALLYTSRGRFPEYDVLVAEMPRYLRCRFIDVEDLRGGRWRDALDALLASPQPPQRPRVDGADVVAKMIATPTRPA